MNTEYLEHDRKYFFHPGTHAHDHASGVLTGSMMERGYGIRLTDANGKEYIDAFAGLWCVNVGYGRAEIADAIAEQAAKLHYYHTYVGNSNAPVVELSRRLIENWAPPGMAKVFYGMSGSDANETQIKLAWYYNNILGRPNKKKVISRKRGYHGSGLVTGGLTGLSVFHNNFDLPFDRIRHTRCPDFFFDWRDGLTEQRYVVQCVEELEQLIASEGADTIAAFIGEPVMGSGGIVLPPAGYWAAIQAVLKQHDILLIADEVVCGFGRTGARMGCERYDIRPDTVTIAKGLTSAYVPLSGVMVSEGMWNVIMEGSRKHGMMGHGWTYSGHPVAAVAALANLDILEREGLVANAASIGSYFLEKLRATFNLHPNIANIRGTGLLLAFDIFDDAPSRRPFPSEAKINTRVAQAAFSRGLIVRPLSDNTIGFSPPLILTKDDVDQIVNIIAAAIRSKIM
jgi:L-2,4-diaminobutyrate transaminase